MPVGHTPEMTARDSAGRSTFFTEASFREVIFDESQDKPLCNEEAKFAPQFCQYYTTLRVSQ
jgi:type VI protein secretion system component VasK